MSRPKYWTNLGQEHLDAHNAPIASTAVISHQLGTQSADFTIPIYVPRFKLKYVGSGLVVNTTITTSGSAYWTIQVYQNIDGRERLLGEIKTNTRNLTASELTVINEDEIEISSTDVIYIKGTKTGSPSNLVNLYCDILIRLQ